MNKEQTKLYTRRGAEEEQWALTNPVDDCVTSNDLNKDLFSNINIDKGVMRRY